MSRSATIVDCFRLPSPIGELVGFVKDEALCGLDFGGDDYSARAVLERRFGPLELRQPDRPPEARDRLEAYLAGALEAIDAIRVDTGGT